MSRRWRFPLLYIGLVVLAASYLAYRWHFDTVGPGEYSPHGDWYELASYVAYMLGMPWSFGIDLLPERLLNTVSPWLAYGLAIAINVGVLYWLGAPRRRDPRSGGATA